MFLAGFLEILKKYLTQVVPWIFSPPSNKTRLVTTKGHQIKTFISSEDDSSDQKSNDDKILDTALNLCKSNTEKRIGEYNLKFYYLYFGNSFTKLLLKLS